MNVSNVLILIVYLFYVLVILINTNLISYSSNHDFIVTSFTYSAVVGLIWSLNLYHLCTYSIKFV